MSDAPVIHIDPAGFAADPYPTLAGMRRDAPISFVPELGATLLTKRALIHREEKRIETFSSVQPGGLMEKIMGLNMMRQDGAGHMAERKAVFPALSPRTVLQHWAPEFERIVEARLDALAPQGGCDLVTEYAMPVSGAALCAMTGLTNITPAEMDRASQEMLDAVANYAADPEIDRKGFAQGAFVDAAIDERLEVLRKSPDRSILSVLDQSGMKRESIGANIKVIIGGGQNEPRDAIAGTAWAVLSHPEALARLRSGAVPWLHAFEEYARWISPIGMSPRRVAQRATVQGVTLEPEDRVFLMFGSGNRDESVFTNPDRFDLDQDIAPAISFGAGPHFCAGAWASRALIGEVALPLLFERLPGLALDGEARFGGWAFRGPITVPVRWEPAPHLG